MRDFIGGIVGELDKEEQLEEGNVFAEDALTQPAKCRGLPRLQTDEVFGHRQVGRLYEKIAS